jgi:ABC-2 type transport system permease protein
MSVSPALFLLAKVIPYLVINQCQLIVMLLIGVFIVPLLGGDTLSLGHSYMGIVLLSLAVGIAAMGFALLIAVVAKTTEQATSLGGVGNILCGALGGIMVPKFIMPDAMQQATMISPMSWGLEGFLDLFLRQGSVVDIAPELGVLVSFGVALGLLALFLFRKVV